MPRASAISNGPGEQPVYVDLHFEANNLIKSDKLSKSDPFVVVFERKNRNTEWKEVGRTDTVYDSHKCTFGRPVPCRLVVGQGTELKFEVWDRDSQREALCSHDFMGSFSTTSSATLELARRGVKEKFQLGHPNCASSSGRKSMAGELYVIVETRAWRKRERELSLQMEVGVGRRVTTTPVLQFELQRERVERPGEFVAVHRTEPLETVDGVKSRDGKRDYVVKYRAQSVIFDDLCNDDGRCGRDETTRVRIIVFVVEKRTIGHAISRPVGCLETSVEDLMAKDGSMRQMRMLSRPAGGLLPFGAIDSGTRKGGRGVFAMADDLMVRFSEVVLEVNGGRVSPKRENESRT